MTKLAILSYFVHGETFEVQHEIYRVYAWSLNDTQNLLGMFNLHQIFPNMSPKLCF